MRALYPYTWRLEIASQPFDFQPFSSALYFGCLYPMPLRCILLLFLAANGVVLAAMSESTRDCDGHTDDHAISAPLSDRSVQAIAGVVVDAIQRGLQSGSPHGMQSQLESQLSSFGRGQATGKFN